MRRKIIRICSQPRQQTNKEPMLLDWGIRPWVLNIHARKPNVKVWVFHRLLSSYSSNQKLGYHMKVPAPILFLPRLTIGATIAKRISPSIRLDNGQCLWTKSWANSRRVGLNWKRQCPINLISEYGRKLTEGYSNICIKSPEIIPAYESSISGKFHHSVFASEMYYKSNPQIYWS